jgi:hypothetical protein
LISTPARAAAASEANRDRGRDDQRAGTGDDEQHQRPVEPVAPRGAEEERRRKEDENREQHDRRRIDAGEAFDPLLRRRTGRDLGPRHRPAGVAVDQLPGLLEAAREDDMQHEAEQDAGAAGRREEGPLAPMAVGLAPASIPRRGAHAGRGDGLDDGLARHIARGLGDGHSAVQDIERKPLRAADDRPHRLLEDRDFLGAIHALHLEGAAGA